MDPDTGLEFRVAQGVEDGGGALEGGDRAAERREEPVAGGVDLRSAEAQELRADEPIPPAKSTSTAGSAPITQAS
jgi:hypothetical protein